MYQPRVYRHEPTSIADLQSFEVLAGESDLLVRADQRLETEVLAALQRARDEVQQAIARDPLFQTSLTPRPNDPLASPVARRMLEAGTLAGVGPMAAVAGAIAEAVGRHLLRWCATVLVENGGDLFLAADRDLNVGVSAGDSPLSGRVALLFAAAELPVGVATSSATVGHSLSLGAADAACVVADDAALADACATALGNLVSDQRHIEPALQRILKIHGVRGALVIINDKLGAAGRIRLARR